MRRLTRDEFWDSSTQTGSPDTWPKVGSSGHTLPPTVSYCGRERHRYLRGEAFWHVATVELAPEREKRRHLDGAISLALKPFVDSLSQNDSAAGVPPWKLSSTLSMWGSPAVTSASLLVAERTADDATAIIKQISFELAVSDTSAL